MEPGHDLVEPGAGEVAHQALKLPERARRLEGLLRALHRVHGPGAGDEVEGAPEPGLGVPPEGGSLPGLAQGQDRALGFELKMRGHALEILHHLLRRAEDGEVDPLMDVARSAEYPGGARYIHQRINLAVFCAPEKMMENLERVAAHLKLKSKGPVLSLRKTGQGAAFWRDSEAGFWRTFDFIPGSRTVDTVERPEQAFEAARSFGEFQRLMCDLPGPRLNEIVPGFHDTGARYAALENALS